MRCFHGMGEAGSLALRQQIEVNSVIQSIAMIPVKRDKDEKRVKRDKDKKRTIKSNRRRD